MCVHVHITTGAPLPGGVLTWVVPEPVHTMVYADASLARDGHLTVTGRAAVDAVLVAATGRTLAAATPCRPATTS